MPRFVLLLTLVAVPVWADEPRRVVSLDGPWRFRRDGSDTWKTVAIPSTFQEHESFAWHGVGVYERTLDVPALRPGERAIVQFDGIATRATVRVGSVEATHVGAWTPFRVAGIPAGKHTLSVRVDEAVGHNTQGFLPIIQPHFGGVWQPVHLLIAPERGIDETKLSAIGDPATGRIVLGGFDGRARRRVRGESSWSDWSPTGDVRVPSPKLWSPASPTLYEVEVEQHGDRVTVRAAFRTVVTKGPKLLLNGQPLIVRGVLNWGHQPPKFAPSGPPEVWRKEIEFAKAYGFNLIKFCLWVPPRAYLDLCDELGMLAWVEYPTWHPKLDAKHRAELRAEFAEFFALDRNHPCVVLRSLTCETGPSADIAVIRDLYDLAKSMIPGCVIEDDSSWIEWNRVHDFYDDHPYGNNHTWPATLQRLNGYVAKHGVKPLMLGEAIAADTWVDPESPAVNALPAWARPGFLDGNRRWLARMRTFYGPGGLDRLEADSKRYALLMRRYQIEEYRRAVPDGGYVVSVLRDFPLAGMGLIGFDGKPKWAPAEWAWHGRDETPQELRATPKGDSPAGVVVNRLTADLLDKLEAGGNVLMVPDDRRGSFPLKSHWFLRGAPYLPDHPLWATLSRDELIATQHFDLAGDVIPDIGYLDQIDPLVLLWDNHDMKEVKTHALAFETRVGKGRLFVTALNHGTPYGQWLLGEFHKHVAHGPRPKRAMSAESLRHLREKLAERVLDLTPEPWRFRPDPKNDGLQRNWHQAATPTDDGWSDIRVGKAWEAQGWPTLDGWAWYRRTVTVPADWKTCEVYIRFDGVDDHYELYVNGTKAGEGGDIAAKRTAFDDKASHRVTNLVKPGETASIAVRVYDWYGAGGIHRPVTMSTAAHNPAGDWIR